MGQFRNFKRVNNSGGTKASAHANFCLEPNNRSIAISVVRRQANAGAFLGLLNGGGRQFCAEIFEGLANSTATSTIGRTPCREGA